MTDVITIAESKATESLEAINKDKMLLMTSVEKMVVDSPETLTTATDLLKKIKDKVKWLETDRKSIVGPINASVSEINKRYKPVTEFLEELKGKLDQDKIVPYQMERLKIAREEEEKKKQEEFERLAKEQEIAKKIAEENDSKFAQDFADQKEAEALKVAEKEVKVKTTFKTDNSTSSLRVVWSGEITDASLVPREYCEPSQKLINEAVKNGVREMPGVKIEEKASTLSRGA